MISILGLVAALTILIVLTMRGMSLFIATPLCALVVAFTSGIAPLPLPGATTANMVGLYMDGFSGFIASWFFMFLFGSVFGKVMEDTGCADSIVRHVSGKLGVRHAALAVVLACAVLTYGGVSLFVVAFSVYPMAVGLFREADLPRRFIPAALSFGSVTFTMTSAGSPEIQNWIPIQFLGTNQYAGWQASIIVALFMAVFGQLWLGWMIRRAKAKGERFEARDDDPANTRVSLPNPYASMLPLLTVLGMSFVLHEKYQTAALIVALLAGAAVAALVGWSHQRKPGQALADAATGALIAIGNTAAVVGFGAVAKASPAFIDSVQWVTHLPGGGLVSAAIAVSLIAAMTGSASGGQAIALPIIAPIYTAQGVAPDQLHRVVAISSGVLDSLPHNGYVVTTIRAICNDTHARAYPAVGALTVIVPLAGVVLCIALFAIGL